MKILLIEDDSTARYAMHRALKANGREILEAVDGETGVASILADCPDLVFLDLNMPNRDGLAVLGDLQTKRSGGLPEIIVVTANDSLDIAVECIRRGASDFLTKPYDLDHVRAIVTRSQQRIELEQRVIALQEQLDAVPELGKLASLSPLMHRVFEQVRKAAKSTLPALIRGESGTGKELIARELHRLSDRSNGPFIAVNTAAISEHLIESELFGHVKGAFTGADRNREGVFRKAAGGTLFLDEIGDMPAPVQTRLLRVLQEQTLTPVGSEEEIAVDVRVVSATHQELESAIEEKRFRADLYYRLKGIELRLPPLRTRREDIVLLAHRFAGSQIEFDQECVAAMLQFPWPGNVRELKQRVESAVAMATSSRLTLADLGLISQSKESAGLEFDAYFDLPLTEAKQLLIDRFESAAIDRAMKLENNNVSAAARRLGIHRQNLQQKLKPTSDSAS
jgi:DNA-binding NtrC family response regulator